jgi:N-acetylneuraminic acid mutarotase
MQKSIALLLLSLLILTSFLIEAKPAFSYNIENTWVSKAPMHVARADLGVAVVNGDIYAIGGNTIAGEYSADQGFYKGITGGVVNTVEKYDPITDNWVSKTPMPTPRDSFAIAVCQNKIYCIGGRTSIPLFSSQTFTNVNEVYDPATDLWQTKAPLPTMEWPLQASVISGKIFVIGRSGATYAYNPLNDSWTTKTRAPSVNNEPIAGFVTSVFANKIYVIGISDLNLIYNPLNDTWSQVNSSQPYSFEGLMGYGSFRAAGGTTSGILAPERIYVFFENRVYVYSPANDSWLSGASMPEEIVDFGAAVINDTFYIIGGSNYPKSFIDSYAPTATNEQYLPVGYGAPDPSYVFENTPPKIFLLAPLNKTYNDSSISLVFSVDKLTSWVAYSLDAKQNITINGNDTITNMTNGLHIIKVYANDTFGNVGASQTISFTVTKPEAEAFSTATVTAVLGAAVLIVATAGLLVYFKRRSRPK